ncbi:MAG: hypothetical protein GKR88_19875 [Flavobacteriaceae bacterium]|nr:MAG: hypothetical protein GKR88_19875 [Flavobacteriaceae bacterium]
MPFGLKIRGFNNVVNSSRNSVAEKRMFGGKECNEELGLNWYDITARNYDLALGRWVNLDPLTELMFGHCPYNYAFDNPIYFIYPDGMTPREYGPQTGYYNDGRGNIVYDPNINNQKDVDDLGLYGATYIGDVYYDESSGTYYDEQGKIHENRYFNWQCMCYRWSFSRWWSNLGSDFKGTAVDRIGSGFVIKGKASGSGGLNTRSNHPEDDIEIPEEVINALKGITGKFKGATGRKKVSL